MHSKIVIDLGLALDPNLQKKKIYFYLKVDKTGSLAQKKQNFKLKYLGQSLRVVQ